MSMGNDNRGDDNKDRREQTYLQFVAGQGKHPFIAGIAVTIINSIKHGAFEPDTAIVSLLAIFLLTLCIWKVSTIKW